MNVPVQTSATASLAPRTLPLELRHTVITFTDPQQRKAQKDVVWRTLQSWMGVIEQMGHGDADDSTPVQG